MSKEGKQKEGEGGRKKGKGREAKERRHSIKRSFMFYRLNLR